MEYHPATSLPTNQEKVTHPVALTPNFAFKNSSLKTIREFGLLNTSHLFSLPGPTIHISLLQTLTFQFVWPHCASGSKLGFNNNYLFKSHEIILVKVLWKYCLKWKEILLKWIKPGYSVQGLIISLLLYHYGYHYLCVCVCACVCTCMLCVYLHER